MMLRLIGMAVGAALVISAVSLIMNREKVIECVKDEAMPMTSMHDKHDK